MQMMNKNGFSRCGENYINRLRKEGRYSTGRTFIRTPLFFREVLWYIECVVQASYQGTFTTLWSVSL